MAYVFFFVVFVVAGLLFFIGWRSRRKRINEIFLGKVAALGRWNYTPEEWKKFSEEHFPWVKNKDSAGIFSISDEDILISNGQDEFFRDLTYKYLLAHIEYRDDSSIFYIKMKKLKAQNGSNEKVYYQGYEELSIPLPPGNAEKADRVIERLRQIAREKFEASQGQASTDLVFGQFLNSPTDEDKSQNSQT